MASKSKFWKAYSKNEARFQIFIDGGSEVIRTSHSLSLTHVSISETHVSISIADPSPTTGGHKLRGHGH